MASTVERPWSEPVRRVGRLELPAIVSAAPLGLCELGPARYSACDVWIVVDATWHDVVFELVAFAEGSESIVARARPDDVDGPLVDGSGVVSGLLFAVRGRPCASWVLRAYPDGMVRSAGNVLMRAWGEDSPHSDLAARSAVDLFGSPALQVSNYARASGVVPSPILAPVVGRRIALTRIVCSCDAGGPYQLILSEYQGAASLARAEYWLAAGSPLVEQLTYPLRGRRSWGWQVEPVPGLGANLSVNLTAIRS
jgi:hypothetical protein